LFDHSFGKLNLLAERGEMSLTAFTAGSAFHRKNLHRQLTGPLAASCVLLLKCCAKTRARGDPDVDVLIVDHDTMDASHEELSSLQ
jgi:hypothetical protein